MLRNKAVVRAAKERARLKAAEAERRRLADIEALRQERLAELQACARAVFAWRADFLSLPESSEILAQAAKSQRLPLYYGKFWRGEPAPSGDRSSSAVLCLSPHGEVWYEERYRGNVAIEMLFTTEDGLVAQVHPAFLIEVAAHLAGPDPWKHIENALSRAF
jgi:hypothetical protein